MEPATSIADARSKLIKSIAEAGRRGMDPTKPEAERAAALEEFENLIEGTATWNLIPTLNALIRPGVLPAWLQQELLKLLTLVPLRPDGVRGTLEFVFAVHPSTTPTASEESTPQKRGANITTEALALATKLLATPASSVSPEAWFRGTGRQLFRIIDGDGGPELAKAAAQVIGLGILGKKKYGAPGAQGWNAFALPILVCIKPTIAPPKPADNAENDIVDLAAGPRVLRSSVDLELALRRLSSLINNNPDPSLCKRVLRTVYLELWTLASWANPTAEMDEKYCKPAKSLLETYLKVSASNNKAMTIVKNLLHNGQPTDSDNPWQFRSTSDGGIEVVSSNAANGGLNLIWSEIEHKSDVLAQLLASAITRDELSATFLELFQRWIESKRLDNKPRFLFMGPSQSSGSSVQELLEVSVLQKMMEKAPDKLIAEFDQLLELISGVLDTESQATQPEDVISVILSLLNLVITAPTFRKADVDASSLSKVEAGLQTIADQDRAEISQTARNLALLLRYRDHVEQPSESAGPVTDKLAEERKTYALAMSYITQADSPPPVRSEGLNLISGLIASNSAILDIQAVLVLLSSLMREDEDFLVLRVIQMFTRLASKHPKSTTQELIDHYVDAKELSTTDTRLRFGEALLQVIERLGETFTGDVAVQMSEALLSVAGRRGRRPKTEAKQKREEQQRSMRQREAEDAWGGDVPDMGDESTGEQQVRDDAIAAIVDGWESKRGAEDLRMRASALSLLGTAMETNIAGMGPTVVSTSVDLCINVLVLEREPEQGIVRRAAIILFNSFVNAIDGAMDRGQKLGFGITDGSREDILRTLKYVAQTDNDGMVKMHAYSVIELMEAWRESSLVPQQLPQQSMLGNLAGLQVQVGGSTAAPTGENNPRIEEIE